MKNIERLFMQQGTDYISTNTLNMITHKIDIAKSWKHQEIQEIENNNFYISKLFLNFKNNYEVMKYGFKTINCKCKFKNTFITCAKLTIIYLLSYVENKIINENIKFTLWYDGFIYYKDSNYLTNFI